MTAGRRKRKEVRGKADADPRQAQGRCRVLLSAGFRGRAPTPPPSLYSLSSSLRSLSMVHTSSLGSGCLPGDQLRESEGHRGPSQNAGPLLPDLHTQRRG